jgi:ribonuclease G
MIPPSKFGIIEITRQRVRPETDIQTHETCPTCNGSGEVQASILFAEEIENNLAYLLNDRGMRGITLLVHPYLEAFFKNGLWSRQLQWLFKFKTWIPVRGVTAHHLLQYTFVDKENNEIPL